MHDYVLKTITYYKNDFEYFKTLLKNRKIKNIIMVSIIENYDNMSHQLILINIKMAMFIKIQGYVPTLFKLH